MKIKFLNVFLLVITLNIFSAESNDIIEESGVPGEISYYDSLNHIRATLYLQAKGQFRNGPLYKKNEIYVVKYPQYTDGGALIEAGESFSSVSTFDPRAAVAKPIYEDLKQRFLEQKLKTVTEQKAE